LEYACENLGGLGPLVWEEIENEQTVHRGLAKLLYRLTNNIVCVQTFHSLGVLLKFSDDPVVTKFDLAMNSGVACPFYDYNTFMEFGRAIVNRENGNMEAYKKYLLSSPSNW
jgi:hypothetical protein